MINIQVLNPTTDKYLAFDGSNVIKDSDQAEMSLSVSSINVSITILKISDGTSFSITGTLVYHANVDHWLFDITSHVAALKSNLGKCVAKVSDTAVTPVMRTFKINEFGVYCDDLENVIAKLPYEIIITGTESKLVWYEAGHIGESGYERYSADVYSGLTGTTYARHPSEITHRGDLIIL